MRVKLLKILIIGLVVLGFTSIASAQLNVLKGPQGGTNIGTAAGGDIGNCLKVSAVSPVLVWTIGSCGGGGSGNPGGSNTQVQFNDAASFGGDSNLTFVKGTGLLTGFSSLFTFSSTTNFLATGSSTLQNFTGLQSTTTNATTTNFFATNASTTNLWLSTGTGVLKTSTAGLVGIGVNGTDYSLISALTCSAGNHLSAVTAAGAFTCSVDTGSGTSPDPFTHPITSPFTSATTSNMLFSGSTTLQNFTFINATGTSATTTNSFATNASSTNLFGANISGFGLANCTGTNALTFTGTGFTCTAQPQGTVTAVSVASANGFTGSSSGGATPALTLTTSINAAVLKGNGTAISGASNGTDYTLITALTCSAGNHFSSITAAGVLTCSADSGGGGGGSGGWTFIVGGIYNSTSTDQVFIGATATTSRAQFEVDGTLPITAYFPKMVGVGTTTPQWALNIASSTAPQLALSDGSLTSNSWTFRSLVGTLAVATASPSTYATSTATALFIDVNGMVGIGTQNPTGPNANSHLTVAGQGSQDVQASTTDNGTLSDAIFNAYAPGARTFMGSHGTNQVSSRYGLTLGGYSEIGAFNSTFGSSNGLIIGTNPAVPLIFGTNNIERMRFNGLGGSAGIGTTTPQWSLEIASSTGSQFTLSDPSTNNHWSFRSAGGLFYIATSSASTFATSTVSALSINTSGIPTIPALASPNLCVTTNSSGLLGTGTCGSGASGADPFTHPVTNPFTSATTSNMLFSGSTTLQNFTALNSTSTFATTTSFFSTVASSTNLFATSLNTGLVTSGAINGQTISSASTFTGTVVVTTSVTDPVLIGGSAAGSSLELRSTSGNGVGAEFTKFTVGNNGATEIARVNLAGIGIGTTTPQWELTVSSSTRPQLALTDASVTSAPWVFRSVSGTLFLATSSPSATFATTSMSAITITPNNAVGIGSTSPTQMLSVAGSELVAGNSTTTNLEVKSAAQVSTTSGYALVSVGAPAGVTSYLAIGSTTSNGGSGTVLSVNPQNYASIASGTSSPDAVFAFTASSTSVSAANINILDVASTSAGSSLNTSLFRITTSGAIFAPLTSSSGSSQTGYWCYDANGQLIRDSAVCLVSALKFKKDVKDLDVGLSDLMKLRPVSYFYKDPSFGANQQMGFIADEVASSSPKLNEMLVNYDSTGAVHSFNYMQFTSLITKSLQQLVHQVQIIWVLIGGLILWNVLLTVKLKKHARR